jgi:threonine aldolase
LEHHVDRLAEGLAASGLPVDVGAVETNFVGIDVRPLGIEPAEARRRAEAEGVLLGGLRPGVLRAATYLGIGDDEIDRAVELIPRALGALVRA